MKHIVKVWLLIFFSALLLVGCGGGGDASGETHAGVGSGGTGSGKSYAAGVVTLNANGELVVNGIHFESSTATVENANEPGQVLTVADLKPGMMVEIDATSIEIRDGRQVATAVHIKVISQIQGYVLPTFDFMLTKNEAGTETGEEVIYVLGLPVHIRPETEFDATLPDREKSIKVWDILEVHGFLDAPSGQIIATRVTRKPADTDEFFVKGMAVDIFDSMLPGECEELEAKEDRQACELFKGFRIAGTPFIWQDFSLNLSNLKNSIVDIKFEARLLAKLATQLDPDNPPAEPIKLTATVKFNKANFLDSVHDVYLDGLVTNFPKTSDGEVISQKQFYMNNIQVDATGIRDCPVCETLLPGDRVRIRGQLLEDKVIASSVERIDAIGANFEPVPKP